MDVFLKKTKVSIHTRIITFFGGIFLLIFILILIPSALYIGNISKKDLQSFALQSLKSTDSQLISSIDSFHTLINTIMINPKFQTSIIDSNSVLERNRIISDALFNILINDTNIMSVIFCDENTFFRESNSGSVYSVYVNLFNSEEWLTKLKESNGEFIYFENGGEAVKVINYDKPYISFVRNINKISDYKPMGTLMINITKNSLSNKLFSKPEEAEHEMLILNAYGDIIIQSSNSTSISEQLSKNAVLKKSEFQIVETPNGSMAVSSLKSQFADWYIVSVTPLNYKKNLNSSYYTILLIIAILVIAIIFISQLFISNIIIKPLANLVKHMRLAEKGNFLPIKIGHTNIEDEIIELQTFFNIMITSIDELTKNIKLEEQLKRRNELSLLQAQIKPHFLYNALDAISALSLINDNETAYKLTQALSGFYRTSLSVGKDFVTVEKEIECIKNYATVLNIRYKDKINIKYNISENILKLKMLKLLLQPIIENCVYHGIRNKHGVGNITITGFREDNMIIFIIEDDGVGITQDRIDNILTGKSRSESNGFGIYNLIEKLTIFNENDNSLQITSEVFRGTTVTIKLRILEEDI